MGRKIGDVDKSQRKVRMKNKLECGVGVNDADYHTQLSNKICPYYHKWSNMLTRCYSKKSLMDRPTYNEMYVCNEWLIFSNFRKWMIGQKWKGLELDKDVLYPNNKIYSPKTCCFVPRNLNTALAYVKSSDKELPTGVHYRKDNGKFRSIIYMNGKNVSLGQYDTPNDAHQAYLLVKMAYLQSFYGNVPKRVKKGLKRHVKSLRLHINELGYDAAQ